MREIKRQQCFDGESKAYGCQTHQDAVLGLDQDSKHSDSQTIEQNEAEINKKEVVEEVIGKWNLKITKMEKDEIILQIAEEMEKHK